MAITIITTPNYVAATLANAGVTAHTIRECNDGKHVALTFAVGRVVDSRSEGQD